MREDELPPGQPGRSVGRAGVCLPRVPATAGSPGMEFGLVPVVGTVVSCV